MGLFESEIKISDKFGTDFVISIVEILKKHFTVEFIQEHQLEMDLIIMHYKIDNEKISFLTEGMVGTIIIGKKKSLKPIIAIIQDNFRQNVSTTL